MMTQRFWIAGLVGGVAMYVWASFAHMTPMLAQSGIQKIPAEPAVLAALQSNLGKREGLYAYPYLAQNEMQTPAAKRRLAETSSGLLIYHPPGRQELTPGQLVGEFLLELFEALAATALLARTTLGGFWPRVGFFAGIGLIAAVVTNGSYLIWYGFPFNFTLPAMFTEFMKFVVAGAAAALALGKTPAQTIAFASDGRGHIPPLAGAARFDAGDPPPG
jgi:hypothetical protein